MTPASEAREGSAREDRDEQETEIKATRPDFSKGKFVQVPREVLRSKDLTRSEKMLWAAIYDHDFRDDGCWPTRRTLADILGLSERQITRLTNSLKAKGYLKKTPRTGTSNWYEALVPIGLDAEPVTSMSGGGGHSCQEGEGHQCHTNNTKLNETNLSTQICNAHDPSDSCALDDVDGARRIVKDRIKELDWPDYDEKTWTKIIDTNGPWLVDYAINITLNELEFSTLDNPFGYAMGVIKTMIDYYGGLTDLRSQIQVFFHGIDIGRLWEWNKENDGKHTWKGFFRELLSGVLKERLDTLGTFEGRVDDWSVKVSCLWDLPFLADEWNEWRRLQMN